MHIRKNNDASARFRMFKLFGETAAEFLHDATRAICIKQGPPIL